MADADREKWDARYRSGQHPGGEPSWLREFEGELPGEGKALDVAAGSGRVSVYLARRGLSVTAIDISPVGLALAREAASDEGLEIRTQAIDLERQPLPEGPFDLVACFHYRQRALFPVILSQLEPGGMVVAELPTLRNLERQMRPSKRWLAEPNELLRDCGSLEVLYYREGWLGERHLARLIARRPKR
ncbi:MAG: class I SAM-dependent methyltransferase [Myxococcota bacterium]